MPTGQLVNLPLLVSGGGWQPQVAGGGNDKLKGKPETGRLARVHKVGAPLRGVRGRTVFIESDNLALLIKALSANGRDAVAPLPIAFLVNWPTGQRIN